MQQQPIIMKTTSLETQLIVFFPSESVQVTGFQWSSSIEEEML